MKNLHKRDLQKMKRVQNPQKQNPQKRTQKSTHSTSLQSKNTQCTKGISSGDKDTNTYSYITL